MPINHHKLKPHIITNSIQYYSPPPPWRNAILFTINLFTLISFKYQYAYAHSKERKYKMKCAVHTNFFSPVVILSQTSYCKTYNYLFETIL